LGNAGDESQPNTMALAAEGQSHSTYTGKIGGKIEASLDLFRTEQILRGTITYKKSGKPIMVLGTRGEGNTFFLREYLPDGLITGVMSGEMKDDEISGTWFGTGKGQELKLEMALTNLEAETAWPYASSGSVVGEYGYHYPAVSTGDPGANGGLRIKKSGDQYIFSIECMNGPPGYHMAVVEDVKGTLEGDEINFTIPDFDCQFVIRFFEGYATVEPIELSVDCGFGMGASIEGEYVKLK
jgi:hypothetical protein